MNLESLSVWSYTFQVNALSADRSVRRVWCAVCQRMGLRMLLLLLLLLLSVCLLLWLRCVLTAILLLRKRPVDPVHPHSCPLLLSLRNCLSKARHSGPDSHRTGWNRYGSRR